MPCDVLVLVPKLTLCDVLVLVRCAVMMFVWRSGNIEKNCLYATVLCTIIMVHKSTNSSYSSVDCIRL